MASRVVLFGGIGHGTTFSFTDCEPKDTITMLGQRYEPSGRVDIRLDAAIWKAADATADAPEGEAR